MFRVIGKMLFPKLDRDQQRRRVSNLIVSALAIGFGCGVVIVVIVFLDKR